MNIYNDIPNHNYIYRISLYSRKFQAFLHEELKPLNLTPAEFPFAMSMFYCREEGSLQDHLTKHIGMARSSTCQAMQTMENKGFIQREESEHNKKHKRVFPTQKLYDCEERIGQIIIKWHEMTTKDIDENDMKIFKKTLMKLSANALKYETF